MADMPVFAGMLKEYPFTQAPLPAPSEGDFPLLRFPGLSAFPELIHAFTTRLGGVSKGPCSTLNLSFTRGDDEADVRENHRLVARAIGYDADRAVLSHQTHTDNILVVTEDDAGKGISKEKGYTGIDGLITNVPGIPLIIFTADCVPVLLYDAKKRVIAALHAGWRGTAAGIVPKALHKMKALYGTDAADVHVAIGPSIGPCCYEVSEELGQRFISMFPGHESEVVTPGAPGHAQLNLWAANRLLAEAEGVPASQIEVTNLCTRCHPDLFFSHRVTGDARGNLSAIICLKEENEEA